MNSSNSAAYSYVVKAASSSLDASWRCRSAAPDLDNDRQYEHTYSVTNRDLRHDSSGDVSLDAPATDAERDGVAALHDTEADAGDEPEVADLFDLDRTEARALGADLDRADRGESQLD
jgi:hypothetical protein